MAISWRIGVEVELLAPPGLSRRTLAQALAERFGGSSRRIFYPQVEPAQVPGTPVFQNLTLGYQVLDAQGEWLVSCLDDLSLQKDLCKETPSVPDWYRIVSDDRRLLHLVMNQCDPALPADQVLAPLAQLFGRELLGGPGGMFKVNDCEGATVALVAPLPGERERPCELVTAPLDFDQEARLESYLSVARELGFCAPYEGATHLHFDATPFCSASAFANLVALLSHWGEDLKSKFGTNPNCSRLGTWPEELLTTVSQADFRELSWAQAQERLSAIRLSKFCDFNLVNCLGGHPRLKTVEIRVLPVHLSARPIMEAAELLVELFHRAL